MALTTLLDAIERLPAFVRLLNTVPTPGERRRIGGLPGSADASILAALARRLTNRFFVVATESVTEAHLFGTTDVSIEYFDYAPKMQQAPDNSVVSAKVMP